MRTQRTKAIVLRRTNYGEADRVVQLLTADGRRSVMARGVRKEKSKLAGGIELFAVSDVVIGEGKGDLGVLTSAKLDIFYRHILEDYDRLQFGYQVIKLVSRASEAVDEPEWFELLQETLAGLDATTVPLALVQAWFYARYASLLGHELNVELDVEGNPLESTKTYRYDTVEQGLRLLPQGEIGSEHIKFLRLVSSRPLQVLVQIGGVGTVLPESLRLIEAHAAIDLR